MIAQGLVEAGATVYIASRKLDQCEQTARELSEYGACHALAADISTEDGCRSLVAAYLEREPTLAILVNNSGANWGAPFAEYPDAAWDRVMNLNVRGAFTLTKLLTPALSAAGSADDPSRVIHIALDTCFACARAVTRGLAYAASKAAIHHLTAVTAKRLALCTSRSTRWRRAVREQDDEADPRAHGRSVGVDVAARPHRAGRRHRGRGHLPRVTRWFVRDGISYCD